METKLKEWELLSSEEVYTASPWISVIKDSVKLPSGRRINNYFRVKLQDYVIILARNNNRDVLVQSQYKHAIGKICLGLPTGCIDNNEDPIDAAKRELLEETGFDAKRWKKFGSFIIDGNRGCGKAHFFFAEDLTRIKEPIKDEMEESEVVFLSPDVIIKKVFDGSIQPLASVSFIAIATNNFLII